MIAGSSGITVPYAAGGEAESVAADSAVGEEELASVAGESVGDVTLVSVAAEVGGGVQPANMELATTKLPVTDAINFNASRRDNLPSS
jgi:hypothetical protein